MSYLKPILTIIMFSLLFYLVFFISNNDVSLEYMDNISTEPPINNDHSVLDPNIISSPNLESNNDVSNSDNSTNTSERCDNKKCGLDRCGSDNLFPILDPRFNMRETAKQCLLLEDHLNNKKKRCLDCIRKHFLIIDGLLEEAVSLEKDNTMREYYRDLFKTWIDIQKSYSLNKSHDNMDNISKTIRIFRKPLVEKYFDDISDYDNTL